MSNVQLPLVIDALAEVYDLLRPWATDEFWDIEQHTIQSPAVYVFGRQQVVEHRQKVRDMCARDDLVIVFGNSAEGSTTLIDQCDRVLGLQDLIRSGRLLLISGGSLPADWPYLQHEHFISRVLDYEENQQAVDASHNIYRSLSKPYKFLMLNGRARPHRRYLVQRLQEMGLLDQALWTMLDGRRCDMRQFDGSNDNMTIRHLPKEYEVPRYQFERPDQYPHQFIKHDMFRGEWGDIYLYARPYQDTYFSLVTETVYETEHSFRTEKIAKPLAMGHPWICAANPGFYRDLRHLGFQTFEGLIDEGFDQIEDHQRRMDRILNVVDDLCQQDLGAFLREAEPVCKYNQQFLPEFIREHRKDFPGRFQQFIQSHARS